MVTTTAPARTPAAERILAAASRLFYDEGIHSVGVEAIAGAAGVTKKTLYDRFGSKDRIIEQYLRDRDQLWRGWLTAYVERHATAPAEKLLATFDALGAWMRERNPRGCAFVNAHAEIVDPEHPASKAITEQKLWVLDYLIDLADELDVADPVALGQDLTLLFEGATVTYSLGIDDDAAARARRMAQTRIEAAKVG